MNKHKWVAVAADFNSPFTRNYLFVKSFFSYPKLGAPRLPFAMAARRNNIEYIPDMIQWQVCHDALKKLVEKDMYFVDKLIDKTMKLGEEVNAETEKELFKADITKIEAKELVRLLQRFIDGTGSLYTYGTLLPILDFGGFAFVEGNLNKFLKEKLSPKEYAEAYAVFTAPPHNSFQQDQEEYLQKLQPDEFQRMILNVDGKVVWSKPRRKDYQSKSYYHSEKLMKEIGRRLGLTLEEARSTPIDMIENALLHEKPVNKEVIKQVFEFHVCVPLDNGTVDVLYG